MSLNAQGEPLYSNYINLYIINNLWGLKTEAKTPTKSQ